MQIHKVILYVIDHDNVGPDALYSLIEDAHYPNHCIAPKINLIETKDFGEWRDDHPLNRHETFQAEVDRIFQYSIDDEFAKWMATK